MTALSAHRCPKCDSYTEVIERTPGGGISTHQCPVCKAVQIVGLWGQVIK